MSWPGRLHGLRLRLLRLARRDALRSELDEELGFHLASLVEQNRRAGMGEEAAERQARLRFGNPLVHREASHELFSFVRVEGWLQEGRHALRRLRRAPVFTAVALVTLALGIGANAALFSVVDAALVRPLPYSAPHRLLALTEPNLRGEFGNVSFANLADYAVPALAGLTAHAGRSLDLTGAGEPVTLRAQQVGPGFFAVLGATTVLGRSFLKSELDPGAPAHVTLLSHRLFVNRLAGDSAIVGRTLRLDGEPYLVVGVLSPAFRAPAEIGSASSVDLFVPLALGPDLVHSRGDHEVDVVARLAEGATLEQARAQLAAVGEALAREYPESNADYRPRIVPLHDALAREARPSLLVLGGAVAAALLIACLNLSNLLLVRSLAHAREIAVRVALGAGWARALRGTLLEAGLLALGGGALGLVVATGVLRAAAILAPAAVRVAEARLDSRVLAVSFLLALATALLAALLPASGVDPGHPGWRSWGSWPTCAAPARPPRGSPASTCPPPKRGSTRCAFPSSRSARAFPRTRWRRPS